MKRQRKQARFLAMLLILTLGITGIHTVYAAEEPPGETRIVGLEKAHRQEVRRAEEIPEDGALCPKCEQGTIERRYTSWSVWYEEDMECTHGFPFGWDLVHARERFAIAECEHCGYADSGLDVEAEMYCIGCYVTSPKPPWVKSYRRVDDRTVKW